MYSRYDTHYFCSVCGEWRPHEEGQYCFKCNKLMRSRPRTPKNREKSRLTRLRRGATVLYCICVIYYCNILLIYSILGGLPFA